MFPLPPGSPPARFRPLTGSSPLQTATTTLTYGDSAHPGDVTKVADPNSHATNLTYDANGDLISVTDAMGDTTTYAFDGIGNLLSETSPRGNPPPFNRARFTTTATYNAAGDMLTVTDPLGNLTQYTYDTEGNVNQVTDSNGHPTTYAYNLNGNLSGVTNPDNTGQSYTYDPAGNLLSQNMLSSTGTTLRTLRYTYDALDRVSTALDPGGRVSRLGYDAAGNVTAYTDQMNRTTNYSYDNANELTGVAFHDAGTHDVGFTYTVLGQRATMDDGTGTSTYTYDSLGRLTKTVNGAGAEVDYRYDLAGNLALLTYPGSVGSVTRKYDNANRVTDIIDWKGNDTQFSYDANSNIVGETLPSGTNTRLSFAFDNADQLKQIVAARPTGSNPFRWTFGYGRDPLGQVTGSTDRESGMRHGYSYDPLNRLTQDLRANRTSASWTYDATNNLRTIQDTASNITKTLTYDANNNQLTGMQTTGSVSQNLGFSYNGNGDRTTTTDLGTNATINSYGYNQADQLTSFTQSSTSATYGYDGDGLRASKTVNGTSEAFTWDIAEGTPLIIQDGSTRYITGSDGLPLEQIDGSGNVLYYVQDQLGSTRGLVDGSGAVQGTYTYGVYGDLEGHSGGAGTPFGYAGQYTDAESGLTYMRARYYDPATAEFVSVDPLLNSTQQPYAYTVDDPLNVADPSGRCPSNGAVLPPAGPTDTNFWKGPWKTCPQEGPVALSRWQIRVAKIIYWTARSYGLSDGHAKEMVAAAYMETFPIRFDPKSKNPTTGAEGVFQLIGDYYNWARSHGGVDDPAVNTRAVINSYKAYWRQYPHARLGAAAAGVEKSECKAAFYAEPLIGNWIPWDQLRQAPGPRGQ